VVNAVRFRIVLFDLDGTLIDSGPIILASMQHATKTVLGREIAYEELAATVGGQGLVSQMRALDPDRVDELVEVYKEHNDPLHETLEAFDDLLDVLPRLRVGGRRLGIVTAKRRKTIELAFGVLDLERFFDAVVTADDTTRHKPDPEPVREALRRLDAQPEDAAFVGDSPFDMGAARAAGVLAVGVGWGGIHQEEALREAGADVVVHSFEELRGVL